MSVLFEILITAVFSFLMSPEPEVEKENANGEELKQVQEILFQDNCPSQREEDKKKRAVKYLAALSNFNENDFRQ